MEWTTHALSGLIVGYQITGDWKGALVGGIGSILPDLDEPKSKFGKPFFFISLPLNQLVGHRTLTHSVPFAIFIGIITSAIWEMQLGLVAAVGILTHIAEDMLTGKVQLLFPMSMKLGVSISRFNYILIDRIARLSLVVLIGITAFKEVSSLI